MAKMAVKASSKYKGGEIIAEQYQVGKVYQTMPGVYQRYEGNNVFTGVANPNAASEAQSLRDKLGALYKRLYDGDKTVIPEIEKLSNVSLQNKSAYDYYKGNQDQLDSLINAGVANAPSGYKTKLSQAQAFADNAIAQAKIYSAELAKVGGDVTKVSAIGFTARTEMLKALKKEASIIGGGYNDYNEESIAMLADNLASGKYKPNAYEPRKKTYQEISNTLYAGRATETTPKVNTATQPITQKQAPATKGVATTQYNPAAMRAKSYIATQKAPAAVAQSSQATTSTTSGYTPASTRSRMSQAIQQPTYSQTNATALKQKGWTNKKII